MSSSSSTRSNAKSQRYTGSGKAGADRGLYFSECDPATLRLCVDAVTRAGDAVLLARTSDGGAFSVRVLSDGQVFKSWPSSLEELHETLNMLADEAVAVL